MSAVVILGAGFSYVGGLPLTAQLFDGPLPISRNGRDKGRMESVRRAYKEWQTTTGDGPEQWLRQVYDERENPPSPLESSISWHAVVQYVLRRLCTPKNADAGQYYYCITRHSAQPLHAEFWNAVLGGGVRTSIVTLNYDLLVERALHARIGPRETAPRFYYGGFQYDQFVRKMVNVAAKNPADRYLAVPLGHEIPVYKLHGSLNWAWEPHSLTLKIHDDVRAAFRDEKWGVAAIIPPIEEKKMSPEFGAIWTEAEKSLALADRWVVCGYSAPSYDYAVRNLFRRSAEKGPRKTVLLIDPNGGTLSQRWNFENVGPILTASSIPDAMTRLAELAL